jgi:hypothetical protein
MVSTLSSRIPHFSDYRTILCNSAAALGFWGFLEQNLVTLGLELVFRVLESLFNAVLCAHGSILLLRRATARLSFLAHGELCVLSVCRCFESIADKIIFWSDVHRPRRSCGWMFVWFAVISATQKQ